MDTNKKAPGYLMPLFFTSKTQEIFQCKADKDVTEASPYMIIAKEKILKDFKNRAAISDFHPARKIIESYPSEELLVVYDPMFKYGQNFCLVTDDKYKQSILEPPPPPESVEAEVNNSSNEDLLGIEVRLRLRSPKPWKSLGSEQEVEDEILKNSREKIKYILKRERYHFGNPINFTDHDVDKYVECVPSDVENFIKMNELDKAVQDLFQMKDVGCQTNWSCPRNACIQYEARCYKEDEICNIMQSQEILDFFSQVIPRFEHALKENSTLDIFTNDFCVLGEEDSMFLSKSEINLKEYQSFTDLQFSKNKAISEVQWHPSIKGLIAVSCVEHMSFYDRVDNSTSLLMEPSLILLWSFGDPIHPLLLLESPTDALCFKFNPTNPNIIIAGCLNGQVVLWDITEYADRLKNHLTHGRGVSVKPKSNVPVMFSSNASESTPIVQCIAVSSIEKSHHMAVTDIQWIPDHIEIGAMGVVYENTSGLCSQLLSCSCDGTVLFWDIGSSKITSDIPKKKNQLESYSFQHLVSSWKPLLRVAVHRLRGTGEYSTVKCLISEQHYPNKKNVEAEVEAILSEIDPFEQPFKKRVEENQLDDIDTRFLVATEDGELICQDWIPTKSIDTGKMVSSPPSYCLDAHDGKINTLQRSPFMKNIILTVGGWSFSLWKKDVTFGPLFQSFPHNCQLSSGCWSPTRPGVFFIGRVDGCIDIWDFLDKSHEPFLSQSVTSAPITAVFPYQISKKQQLLAVSDEVGTLHVMEVPWNLKHASNNEVAIIEMYFEREASRLFVTNERRSVASNLNKVLAEEQNVTIAVDESLPETAEKQYLEYLELEKQILADLDLTFANT